MRSVVGAGRGAALALLLVLLAAGCGLRSSGPPGPGETRGAMPSLQDREVMVLPAQRVVGVGGRAAGIHPDDEIGYALERNAPHAQWILPPELREALEASPGVDVRLEGLDVGVFLQAEVERIGDPLYGHVRRLAALTGASLALIPVQVRHRRETEESPAAVEVTAVLLNAERGHVLWFGVAEGSPGTPDDPAAMATAAEALTAAMGFRR